MHFDTLKSQLICWRDISSIRIEEAFTNNIADLEEQIQLVSNTDLLMEVKSQYNNDTKPDPKALQSQYLDPLVHRWVQRHIEPVLGQIQMDAEQLIRTLQMSSVNIETVDGIDPNKVFLANKATAMSAILMGGAYFGVQQVTRSALFGLITTTSTVISWPVLLVGLGLFIYLVNVVHESHLIDGSSDFFFNFYNIYYPYFIAEIGIILGLGALS